MKINFLILFLTFITLTFNFSALANIQEFNWASLKYNKTYLRTGPSKNNKVIWVYKRKGLPLKILRTKNNWNEVQLPKNQKGWISSSQISSKRNVIIENRLSPSDMALLKEKRILVTNKNAQTIAYLEEGVIASLKSCKKDFCEIELKVKKDKYFLKNSYKLAGFVKKEFLWGVNQ